MLCNIGFKTDRTIGKSSIQFKDLKKIKFDTPIAICDNGNISQLIKCLGLNNKNIPSVELYVVNSYKEKRPPSYVARFFALDSEAYISICKMIEIANSNKRYSPRIEINDLILDGNIKIIVDPEFLFINELPYDKTFIALNANFELKHKAYYKYNPIFYYDSFALTKVDLDKIEVISSRKFKHHNKVVYYDNEHYLTAALIPESIKNYENILYGISEPVIKFDNKYPIFHKDADAYFDALVIAGFKRKCPQTQEYRERLEYEKEIIKKLGYCDYFLINWDFIDWSRKNDIPIGPGRGSAAGSIVAYCLDITKLDPIANGLYFERFLNPERVSPPDIDTDINTNDRQFVIDYIKTKYGEENVSQIITFSELKSKSALKDAARLHNVEPSEVDKITKVFPPTKFGVPPTLEEAYEISQVKEWAQNNKIVWEEAKQLEGYTRQTGIHAAGLIISPKPINTLIGLSYTDKNEKVCQFTMSDAEKFGLLKMDFLGLATLGLIKDTMKLLNKSYYSMEDIPLDDINVINAFRDGNTHGIFQFESDGMRRLLRRIAPDSFSDIAAATALYRPGPLTAGLTEEYIHNKHSINPEYFLPEFKDLLAETYGVFVYQEQVMLVAQRIAGFSLSKADTLRKAIGKKNKELMKTLEDEFIDGSVNNGYDKTKAQKLWGQIVGFADYCFNKSHSYAYSLISYWTMYLKVYYPNEFSVSLLSSDMKNTDKLRLHFYSLRDIVKFVPPYINEAKEDFSISGNGEILIGYGALKGMGNSATSIYKNQPYSNIIDVVLKNKLDSSQLNSLIYSGAFDKLENDKSVLLGNSQRMLRFGKNNTDTQIYNIFDPVDIFTMNRAKAQNVPEPRYLETLCYGFNIYHGFIVEHDWLINSLCDDIIIGEAVEIKKMITKRGQEMAFMMLETVNGKIKCVLFPNQYKQFKLILSKDNIYAIKGNIKNEQNRDGEDQQTVYVDDMLTEQMITPTKVNIVSEMDIDTRYVDILFKDIRFKKGVSTMKFYKKDIDFSNSEKFIYNSNIYYAKEIHDILKLNKFEISIDLF